MSRFLFTVVRQTLGFVLLAWLMACGSGGKEGSSGGSVQAPSFKQHPASVTLQEGQTATFSVAVTGNPTPTLQWQRSTDGATWTDISDAIPMLSGSAVFSFPAQAVADGSRVRAKARNSAGAVESQAAVLTVQWLHLTAQPEPLAVSEGQTAVFKVVVDGNPKPSIQWQRSSDGATWVDLPGAVQPECPIAAQLSDHGAQFRARITNGVTSLESSAVKLAVVVPTIITSFSSSCIHHQGRGIHPVVGGVQRRDRHHPARGSAGGERPAHHRATHAAHGLHVDGDQCCQCAGVPCHRRQRDGREGSIGGRPEPQPCHSSRWLCLGMRG